MASKSAYLNEKQFIYKRYFDVDQRLLLGAIVILSILFPIIIPHTQFILGVIINILLILSALYLDEPLCYLPAFVPSLIVFALAILFSKAGGLPALLLPVIWAGNLSLIVVIRTLKHKKLNNLTKTVGFVALPPIIKSILMGVLTFALIHTAGLKTIFLLPMSLFQFITATTATVAMTLVFFGASCLIGDKNVKK